MHQSLTRYTYDKLKGGDCMNDALEALYKHWYDNTESCAEYQEMCNLFCDTGDKTNDDMNFAIIAKATSEESKMAFYAGFHAAMSLLTGNNN